MPQNDVLQKIYSQVATLEDQSRKLSVQKQAAQSTLETIGSQEQKLLATLAGGDTTVSTQLDALDTQETGLKRQIAGIELVLVANSNAIEDLKSQAAPIEVELQTLQVHRDLGEQTDAMNACADELEQILELGANRLAELMGYVTAIYTTSGVRSDATQYRNQCVTRAEKLRGFARLNVGNGLWKSPPPIHPSAFVPASLEIIPAISPEVVQSAAA